MLLTRTLHGLTLLALLLSACAPSPTATSAIPIPESTLSSPTATVEAEEEPPPPSGLTDLLDEGIASGEWTESEGLIRLLGFLSGEADLAGIPRAGEMLAAHGTGLIARARDYMQANEYDPSVGDLERLLRLLIPSQEDLDRFSISETSLRRSPGFGAPAAQPPCEEIWRTGWAEDALTGCFIRRDLGATFTLYYPVEWHDDPSALEPVEAVAEAARASEETYEGALGLTIPRTYLVFSLLGPAAFGEGDDVAAFADGATTPCPVIFLPGGGPNLDYLRQTTAHEIFHCVTGASFSPQLGPSAEATEWWEEGGAEYFSNVAYPTIDSERQWDPLFDSRSKTQSLVRMDYDAYLFFQFLANREGDAGVIAFLHSLPTSGGASDQEDAVAGLADGQQFWHSFGQAYLDGRILDASGRPIRSAPSARTVHIDRAMTIPALEAGPFTLARVLLIFDDKKRYALNTQVEGSDGRESASRALAAPGIAPAGGWESIPVEVNAPCRAGRWLVLATTAAPGGDSRRVEMSASVVEEYPENEDCECLLGAWLLDHASYEAGFLSIIPPGVDARFEGITGGVLMEFGDDGVVRSWIDSLTVRASFPSGNRRALMELLFFGTSSARYVTGEGGTLSVTESAEDITIDAKVTVDGRTASMPFPALAPPTLVSGLYTCEGDQLHVTPIDVGVAHPGLSYDRVAP